MSGVWIRRISITLVILTVASAIVAVWRFLPYSVSYYTDAKTIREPLRNTEPRDILWQPPTPIDVPEINTDIAEYEPRVSWDGLSLFFVRGKPGENADIYESRRSSAGWSPPEPFATICTDADELGPEPSPDGSRLFFYSNRPEGYGGYDIWVTEHGTDGWSAPVNAGAMINTPFNEYSPALTPDGSILYFASNRPRTGDETEPQETWQATIREDYRHHDYDLYFVSMVGGSYGPVATVHELNTSSNEGSPAVSPAGDFLYFSSDRAGGSGGFDLYRSRLLRGGHQPPTSLGPSVNTAANELDPALTSLGYALYFSSDRFTDRSAPAFERDYDLFQTTSREVFKETERIQRTSVDWVVLWKQTWPNLLAAILALALIALLLWLLGDVRRRSLSLLTKCLLLSLLTHLVILFLLTFWGVTTNLSAALSQGSGKVHVTLADGDSQTLRNSLEGQVRGTFVSMESPVPEQANPTVEAPTLAPHIDFKPVALGVQSPMRLLPEIPPPPIHASDAAVEPPTLVTQVAPANLPMDSTRMQIAMPARTEPSKPDTLETSPRVAARSLDESAVKPVAVPVKSTITSRAMQIEPQKNARPMEEFAVSSMAVPATLNEGATSPTIQVRADLPMLVATNSTIGLALPANEMATNGEGVEKPPSIMARQVELNREQDINFRSSQNRQPMAQVAPVTPASKGADVAYDIHDLMAAAVDLQPTDSLPPAPSDPIALPPDDPASGLSLSLPSSDTKLAQEIDASSPPMAGHLAVPPDEQATRIDNPPLQFAVTGVNVTSEFRIEPRATESAINAESSSKSGLSFPKLVDRRETDEPPTLPVALNIGIADAPSLSLSLPTELPAPENPYAQRAPEKRDDMLEEMGGSDETEQAVAHGLAWLAAHQSKDGHWDGDQFDQACGKCGGVSSYQVDVALTGLSLLSFLGGDHTHAKDGPYKENVDRGLKWLMANQLPDGDLRNGSETMYSHGIATIALAEAYGMTNDGRLADSVRRAVAFIERARNKRVGGWRYDPGQVGDTSVLGWQVMALKSAQRAGVDVAATSFEAAGAWLDLVTTKPGIYAYQPEREVTPAMTAEGMFVRYVLGGRREAPHMRASGEFILERLPDWKKEPNTYYWYYATLATHQHQGDAWKRWNEAIKAQLLMHQRKNGKPEGSWDPVGEWSDVGGRVYQTALCTLMLEVYYRYLPMYKLDSGATGGVGTTLGSAAPASP